MGRSDLTGAAARRRSPAATVVALALVAAACAGGGRSAEDGPDAGERPRNVVIILVDALRADHLGCYGYDRGTTPEIDRLSERAVVFERAYSNATFTFPSTASLFSATLPRVHRVTHDLEQQERIRRLSDEFLLFPEVFHEAGYRTALLTFPGWVSTTANYLQGVDVWREATRSDEDLAAAARDFISESQDVPFMLYLHLVDMHDYFFPAHMFAGLEREGSGLSDALWSLADLDIAAAYERLAKELAQPGVLSEADLAHLVDLYDRRLRVTDAAIGSVVRHLEELGLADDTVVVITSDHGEQFLEHGTLVHGGAAFYNELIHIPLIFANPELFPGPVRATTPATSIDLAPTVLDLVGLEVPALFQGESLVDRYDEERVVFAQDFITWKAISRRWSYIICRDRGREELYDLEADPGETVNVLDRYPEEVARLQAAIRAVHETSAGHPYRHIQVEEVDMPQEQREALESLGYLN